MKFTLTLLGAIVSLGRGVLLYERLFSGPALGRAAYAELFREVAR